MVAIQPEVAGLRRFGSAALDLTFIAAGRFDGYWERNLSPWDIAAGMLLVREAGGFVTTLVGKDDVLETGDVLAGNESIHAGLLKILKSVGKSPPRSRDIARSP